MLKKSLIAAGIFLFTSTIAHADALDEMNAKIKKANQDHIQNEIQATMRQLDEVNKRTAVPVTMEQANPAASIPTPGQPAPPVPKDYTGPVPGAAPVVPNIFTGAAPVDQQPASRAPTPNNIYK